MPGDNSLWAWLAGRRPRFRDREAGGRALAAQLSAYAGRPDTLVLALPRGGVPVAYEVAQALDAPLDLLLVRKLGAPGERELAMGALAEGGVRVLNDEVVRALRVRPEQIAAAAAAEADEIARQAALYREGRPTPELRGRTVILIDDGLATGATMRAAIAAARAQEAARIIVASPVAAQETVDRLRLLADEVVAAETPEPFGAIGMWYADFSQVSDDEVRSLLRRAAERQPPSNQAPPC